MRELLYLFFVAKNTLEFQVLVQLSSVTHLAYYAIGLEDACEGKNYHPTNIRLMTFVTLAKKKAFLSL